MSSDLVTGVDFITVSTKDFDAAVEFYGTTLGLERTINYGTMPGTEFETGSLTIAVIESKAFDIEPNSNNHPIAFQVDDVHASRAELESRGVKFKGDILDTGVCHMANFEDPDGNALMLHHRYAPRS